MWPPPLLRDRPRAVQVFLAVILPVLFGAVCGYLLGLNGIAYDILTLLGVLGGINAGYEHLGAREGLVRGVVGGALFALAIVVVHDLTGKAPEADLPASLGVMAVIYTVLGTAFGALGGVLRRRAEHRTT